MGGVAPTGYPGDGTVQALLEAPARVWPTEPLDTRALWELSVPREAPVPPEEEQQQEGWT